jgi:hypothetical protein
MNFTRRNIVTAAIIVLLLGYGANRLLITFTTPKYVQGFDLNITFNNEGTDKTEIMVPMIPLFDEKIDHEEFAKTTINGSDFLKITIPIDPDGYYEFYMKQTSRTEIRDQYADVETSKFYIHFTGSNVSLRFHYFNGDYPTSGTIACQDYYSYSNQLYTPGWYKMSLESENLCALYD